jgi:hypothetical protein
MNNPHPELLNKPSPTSLEWPDSQPEQERKQESVFQHKQRKLGLRICQPFYNIRVVVYPELTLEWE